MAVAKFEGEDGRHLFFREYAMLAFRSPPVPRHASSRIGHLVRALFVAMLALVLTTVALAAPRGAGAADGSTGVSHAA